MSSPSNAPSTDTLIRHGLATLAYRLGKALRGTPESFGDFEAGQGVRTPRQILAHVGDLLDWAITQLEGKVAWHVAEPKTWEEEIARFYSVLGKLDRHIAANGLGSASADKLLQSALADALTHTGQILLLRRLAGIPSRGESYYAADIQTGRVGPDQPAPKREF